MSVPFAALADYPPQAVGVTYRFPVPAGGFPSGVLLRATGTRVAGGEESQARTSFEVETALRPLPAGCGPVAATLRAVDVAEGEWDVVVQALNPATRSPLALPAGRGHGRAGYAPVVRVRAPQVKLGAWPVLVLTGAALGVVTTLLLAVQAGMPSGRVGLLLALACVLGAVGAKGYFLLVHPERQAKGLPQTGLALQGFVLVAVSVLVSVAPSLSLDWRPMLDVTAAGLAVGLAVGRLGCFFGGCCAGRATGSRWGIASSDRQVTVRRIPAQLMEAAWAAVLAALSIALLMATNPRPAGALFTAVLSAYTGGRQMLLPMRDTPRKTAQGRRLVLGLCLVGAIVSVGLLVAAAL